MLEKQYTVEEIKKDEDGEGGKRRFLMAKNKVNKILYNKYKIKNKLKIKSLK